MNKELFAYGCGSPVRLPIIEALAKGSNANKFIADSNPKYEGGDSIVWGLIRGANEIMVETRGSGRDFFQVDNAYFGRNIYFRVTQNALQINYLPSKVIDNRYKFILNQLGKSILPWKKGRNGPIVICPSSNFMYLFMGTTLENWLKDVIDEIQKFTKRPIVIRFKEIMPKDDIDHIISDAWCVVTHVSSAAIDALRLGIPIVTTASCAASSLSTPIQQIEFPNQAEGRDEMFSLLAHGQFLQDEMRNNNVINNIIEISNVINSDILK
jgi:hypothetical protein